MSELFLNALHKWSEVFVHRSMYNFVLFIRSKGLSMSQVNAMFYINRTEATGVTEIGEHLGITSAAASQLLDRLVQHGYIIRSENPQDRRSRLLKLTPAGKTLVRESIRARQQWWNDLAELMSPQEQETVMQALNQLIEKTDQLEKLPEPSPICRH